jgi:hypothetical protein
VFAGHEAWAKQAGGWRIRRTAILTIDLARSASWLEEQKAWQVLGIPKARRVTAFLNTRDPGAESAQDVADHLALTGAGDTFDQLTARPEVGGIEAESPEVLIVNVRAPITISGGDIGIDYDATKLPFGKLVGLVDKVNPSGCIHELWLATNMDIRMSKDLLKVIQKRGKRCGGSRYLISVDNSPARVIAELTRLELTDTGSRLKGGAMSSLCSRLGTRDTRWCGGDDFPMLRSVFTWSVSKGGILQDRDVAEFETVLARVAADVLTVPLVRAKPRAEIADLNCKLTLDAERRQAALTQLDCIALGRKEVLHWNSVEDMEKRLAEALPNWLADVPQIVRLWPRLRRRLLLVVDRSASMEIGDAGGRVRRALWSQMLAPYLGHFGDNIRSVLVMTFANDVSQPVECWSLDNATPIREKTAGAQKCYEESIAGTGGHTNFDAAFEQVRKLADTSAEPLQVLLVSDGQHESPSFPAQEWALLEKCEVETEMTDCDRQFDLCAEKPRPKWVSCWDSCMHVMTELQCSWDLPGWYGSKECVDLFAEFNKELATGDAGKAASAYEECLISAEQECSDRNTACHKKCAVPGEDKCWREHRICRERLVRRRSKCKEQFDKAVAHALDEQVRKLESSANITVVPFLVPRTLVNDDISRGVLAKFANNPLGELTLSGPNIGKPGDETLWRDARQILGVAVDTSPVELVESMNGSYRGEFDLVTRDSGTRELLYRSASSGEVIARTPQAIRFSFFPHDLSAGGSRRADQALILECDLLDSKAGSYSAYGRSIVFELTCAQEFFLVKWHHRDLNAPDEYRWRVEIELLLQASTTSTTILRGTPNK